MRDLFFIALTVTLGLVSGVVVRRWTMDQCWIVLEGGPYEPIFRRVDEPTFTHLEPSRRFHGVVYYYEDQTRTVTREHGARLCKLRFVCRLDQRELPIDHKHNAE